MGNKETGNCKICDYKKRMSNPIKGVRIPDDFGKCTREGGLCEAKLKPKKKDPETEMLEHTYLAGQRSVEAELEAVVREKTALESEMDDMKDRIKAETLIESAEFDMAFGELKYYLALYQYKSKKAYKNDGSSWKNFCQNVIGNDYRTVDKKLEAVSEIYSRLGCKIVTLYGVPFNKIRYLADSFSSKVAKNATFDGDSLIIDGAKIPLTADNKDDIEAAIDTLIETHKREKQSLETKAENLEKNIDKIVKEETRGLIAERDLLIQENKRLKVFAPDDKDPDTWSLEQAKAVQEACIKFVVACRSFVFDKRIVDDHVLQAKVEEVLTLADRSLRELRRQWIDEMDPIDDGM